MKKIDLQDARSKERMTRAIDRAILDGDGGREWEDVCDLMDKAMKYYDDPNFEPEQVVQ